MSIDSSTPMKSKWASPACVRDTAHFSSHMCFHCFLMQCCWHSLANAWFQKSLYFDSRVGFDGNVGCVGHGSLSPPQAMNYSRPSPSAGYVCVFRRFRCEALVSHGPTCLQHDQMAGCTGPFVATRLQSVGIRMSRYKSDGVGNSQVSGTPVHWKSISAMATCWAPVFCKSHLWSGWCLGRG